MITYAGIPLTKGAQFEFELAMTGAASKVFDEVYPSQRRIVVTLQRGQRWPNEMKRGRPVIFAVNGSRFHGRILYRRMHRLVVLGEFRLA